VPKACFKKKEKKKKKTYFLLPEAALPVLAGAAHAAISLHLNA
jgi:hypothetical protein